MKPTRITNETQSVQVVDRGRMSVAWSACCAEVDAVSLNRDGLADNIPSAQLNAWLAADKLHCRSPDGGLLQICLKSLLQCFHSEEPHRIGTRKEIDKQEKEDEPYVIRN